MKKRVDLQMYQENGVTLERPSPKKLRVSYNGLLDQSGANELYIHYGHGERWEKPNCVPMQRTHNGWEGDIPVTNNNQPINMCFKDSAYNWDNNSGWNYYVEPK